MAEISMSPSSAFQIPSLPVRRFTVSEYQKIIAAGILDEAEKVELLHGLIVSKMSRNPPHDSVLGITDDLLRSLLPPGWKVRSQSAMTTADSEPEPDLAVVRGPLSRYARRHPVGADVALVVEAADTSLDRDRNEKGPIYAAARIPLYWILNVEARTVEVYTDPVDGCYTKHVDFELSEEVTVIIDGKQIGVLSVAELFAGI